MTWERPAAVVVIADGRITILMLPNPCLVCACTPGEKGNVSPTKRVGGGSVLVLISGRYDLKARWFSVFENVVFFRGYTLA